MLKRHFPLFLVLVLVLLALVLPLLLPWGYDQIDWEAVRAPAFSGSHILGTDEIGRDRLARLAAGTRITLMVAMAALTLLSVPRKVIAASCEPSPCENVRPVDCARLSVA